MASNVQALITRREYDFANSASSTTTTIVAVRAVDATFGATGELVVRVHANSCTGSSAVRVVAVPISISPEEPQTDFRASAAATASIGSSASAPALVLQSLAVPFGPMLQIQVQGVRDSLGNPCKATISVDLVLRE